MNTSECTDEHANEIKLLKALSHPARLAILEVLRSGEACVCHVEGLFGWRQAYISQQLVVLREAGLVTDRRDGWNIFYHVFKPEVFAVIDAAYRVSRRKAPSELPVNLHLPELPSQKWTDIAGRESGMSLVTYVVSAILVFVFSGLLAMATRNEGKLKCPKFPGPSGMAFPEK